MPTIETLSTVFGRTHTTDSTDATFTSKVPTVTAPVESTDGIIRVGAGGGESCNGLMFVIIGTGADNATITGMRVLGWREIFAVSASTKALWVPYVLCEVSATLSTITGAATGTFGTTYRFADTIALITGTANVSNEVVSPGAGSEVVAHLVVDAKGARFVEVQFDLGTATAANALWARL